MKQIHIFLIFLALCLSISLPSHAENQTQNDIGNVRIKGIDVVQNRIFTKGGRHEFTFGGGWVFDNPFIEYGMAEFHYTYHLRESIGLEFNYTRAFSFDKALIDDLAGIPCDPANPLFDSNNDAITDCGISLDPAPDPFKNIYVGNIVWSPIYGKFSIFSKKIFHFDVFLLAGAGLYQASRSKNFGFNVGLGTKIHLNDWSSLRIDFKNFTVKEGAPFNHIVNNRILSMGMSFYLPTRPRREK
ncbi:MAG: outer membrane beta-barrel domain-containing protein [Bdellovibrionales bacterium]|nr:outer membrane beta-barrel domain-containing protein [Bdellovibrionales bacterium]